MGVEMGLGGGLSAPYTCWGGQSRWLYLHQHAIKAITTLDYTATPGQPHSNGCSGSLETGDWGTWYLTLWRFWAGHHLKSPCSTTWKTEAWHTCYLQPAIWESITDCSSATTLVAELGWNKSAAPHNSSGKNRRWEPEYRTVRQSGGQTMSWCWSDSSLLHFHTWRSRFFPASYVENG